MRPPSSGAGRCPKFSNLACARGYKIGDNKSQNAAENVENDTALGLLELTDQRAIDADHLPRQRRDQRAGPRHRTCMTFKITTRSCLPVGCQAKRAVMTMMALSEMVSLSVSSCEIRVRPNRP
jgi:hypothetical protein